MPQFTAELVIFQKILKDTVTTKYDISLIREYYYDYFKTNIIILMLIIIMIMSRKIWNKTYS